MRHLILQLVADAPEIIYLGEMFAFGDHLFYFFGLYNMWRVFGIVLLSWVAWEAFAQGFVRVGDKGA